MRLPITFSTRRTARLIAPGPLQQVAVPSRERRRWDVRDFLAANAGVLRCLQPSAPPPSPLKEVGRRSGARKFPRDDI